MLPSEERACRVDGLATPAHPLGGDCYMLLFQMSRYSIHFPPTFFHTAT